jgi:hypothetical protein
LVSSIFSSYFLQFLNAYFHFIFLSLSSVFLLFSYHLSVNLLSGSSIYSHSFLQSRNFLNLSPDFISVFNFIFQSHHSSCFPSIFVTFSLWVHFSLLYLFLQSYTLSNSSILFLDIFLFFSFNLYSSVTFL